MLMVTSLIKYNVSSFLYLLFFARIVTIGFYPNRVRNSHNQAYLAKRGKFTQWLSYLIVFTQVCMLTEYLVYYWLWAGDEADPQ